MSNVTLPDPQTIAFMRRVITPITDDMVERALISYMNYWSMIDAKGNMRDCIRHMLLDAVGGGLEDGDS